MVVPSKFSLLPTWPRCCRCCRCPCAGTGAVNTQHRPGLFGVPRGAWMGKGIFGSHGRSAGVLGDPEALQHRRLFNSKAKSRCKGVIIPFISLFIPTPTAERNCGWWLWGRAVTPGLEVAAGDAGAEPGFRAGMRNGVALSVPACPCVSLCVPACSCAAWTHPPLPALGALGGC